MKPEILQAILHYLSRTPISGEEAEQMAFIKQTLRQDIAMMSQPSRESAKEASV